MKHFKDLNNAVFAFPADGSDDGWIAANMPHLIPISDDEADELRAPPPVNPNDAILSQIEAVEVATKTGRFAREFMITSMIREATEDAARAFAANPETTITAASILAAHAGYQKAKLVNDQIIALRAQLT